MITVHHLENSRSQRILWLLEELGVEYQIKHYKRDKKTNLAPQALRDVHPLGKSPVITDDASGTDQVIAESGNIVEYLVEAYGHQLLPERNSDDWLRYRYWMHFAEGSVAATMVTSLIFNAITKKPVPLLLRPITKAIAAQVGKSYLNPTLDAQLALMDQQLSESTCFAGQTMSGADIMMAFPCEAAVAKGVSERYPHIARFVSTIEARPAYQAALAKGGPYQLSN